MTEPFFALIVPAAGSGSRMGGDVAKPYRTIAGRTILEHTISRFATMKGLLQVVVVTSSGDQGLAEGAKKLLPEGVDFRIVRGGRERMDSIRNGLKAITEQVDLVVIHDAVRPFVTPSLIRSCLTMAAQRDAAIVAVPVADTLKRVGTERNILSTPDREGLWQAQTPQVFRLELLRRAYEQLMPGQTATDDASVVELLGEEVYICEGSRDNFKITWPTDLRLAELMLADDGYK